MMPYNVQPRLKARRQSALARREADVIKWENADKAGEAIGKKLDRAREDVANLYAKLGLNRISYAD